MSVGGVEEENIANSVTLEPGYKPCENNDNIMKQ